MHRFYADPMLSDERRFFLNADDTVHAVKVLRMQQGDRAEIISGGQRFLAAVESTAGDRTEFLPVSLLPSTEPAVSFTLFQGLPKGVLYGWLQKMPGKSRNDGRKSHVKPASNPAVAGSLK